MSNRSLPKFGAPKTIIFSSLRTGFSNGGAIFDVDTVVKRKCMRVKTGDSWKWQIVNILSLMKFDFIVDTDQEVLDEIGDDMSDISYE
jgi:hypothetical protein